jgi:predicted nucleic acid-binding protein
MGSQGIGKSYAAYVALAEALEAPLLTCDRKLSGASGLRARVELI